MSAPFDLTKIDLYEVLGIAVDATEKDVIKAYRKKALKYHPDKNSDPSAVEIFHKLSKALEILTDVAAKAAYDKILKARAAAKLREKQLDSKRQKLKHDLEAREQAGVSAEQRKVQQAKQLQAEIERLRKEGSAMLEREQALLREELAREQREMKEQRVPTNTQNQGKPGEPGEPIRIKLKWKCSRSDASNGGYNEQVIRKIFQKYGDVDTVVVSSKKNGTAMLEFTASTPQLMSVETERGLDQHHLTISWLSGQPMQVEVTEDITACEGTKTVQVDAEGGDVDAEGGDVDALPHKPCGLTSERDFEDLVLMRLRQAEERKRIIEEMQREDEAEIVADKDGT